MKPSGTSSAPVNESARLTGSTSLGDMSSARAIAMLSAQPPHSSTRVNSQTRPSETANVERSCPTETATSAPRSEPVLESCGAATARSSANASRSIPTIWSPALRQA